MPESKKDNLLQAAKATYEQFKDRFEEARINDARILAESQRVLDSNETAHNRYQRFLDRHPGHQEFMDEQLTRLANLRDQEGDPNKH